MKIEQDLHIHSYLSSCCSKKDEQTPGNIISRAEQMQLTTIGFADHLWVNPSLTPSGWYSSQGETQISRLHSDLEGIHSDIRVLVGCEAEMIAPGKYGLSAAFAEGFDFVLLSCSHFHMKDFVEQPQGDTVRDLADHAMRFFRSGVRRWKKST